MIDWLIYAAAANLPPVVTEDGDSIKKGVWATVIVSIIGLFGLIVTNWGGWKKTAQDGRQGDFDRLRKEIDGYREDIASLRAEVKVSKDEAATAVRSSALIQLQMVTLQAAFHLVAGELHRSDPDNPVLKQARDLVGEAALTEKQIFDAGLRSLTQGRG